MKSAREGKINAIYPIENLEFLPFSWAEVTGSV